MICTNSVLCLLASHRLPWGWGQDREGTGHVLWKLLCFPGPGAAPPSSQMTQAVLWGLQGVALGLQPALKASWLLAPQCPVFLQSQPG